MAAKVHLVSKQDIHQHVTIHVDNLSLPLEDGVVRVRSKIISMTLNNLTYAALGTKLRWWDAYPLPLNAPEPFNDNEKWGIVPAWGFGEVIESKTSIPKGTLLYGLWPTSSHCVDLRLVPDQLDGHYNETSGHRQKLMTLYNHYAVAEDSLSEDTLAWDASIMPVWGCGYVLNRFCFSSGQQPPIHPSGIGNWTVKDADLTSAVVVSLAASSKTARSLAWNLADREVGTGPLAILKATTSPNLLSAIDSRNFETRKTVNYEDLTSAQTIQWVARLKPSRVIVVDFGSPAGTAQRFHDAIFTSETPPSRFTFLAVGVASESISTDDPRTDKFMVNTSPVIDAAIEAEGPLVFFENYSKTYRQSMDEKAMGSMELSWGSGTAGESGVEGAWEKLCRGQLPRQSALVFRIN